MIFGFILVIEILNFHNFTDDNTRWFYGCKKPWSFQSTWNWNS